MVWQSSPYLQLSSVTLAIALNLAVYTWSRRGTAIGKAFIVLMAGIAEWSLMTVLQLCSDTFAVQAFWHKFWYIGIVTVPVAWFVFVLIYTGRDRWLTHRNLILLGVMPVLTVIATFTDDYFHLMFRNVVWDMSGVFPLLVTMPNIWFWAHTIYSYSLLFLSFVWLVKALFDTSYIYRKQVGILLLGCLVPVSVNLMFVLGPELPGHIDPKPASFSVTGLVAFWGLMRFQLLDIMPVARDTIIKDIRDGIIVVDTMNHVVDLNPAAQGITGYSANEIIGKPLGDAFPGKEKVFDYLYSTPLGDTEIDMGNDDVRRYYKIHTAPLHEKGKLRGHLVLLYDVTEQKKTEQRVQELRSEQQKLRQELVVSVRDRRDFMESIANELRTAFGDVLAGCNEITLSAPPEPVLRGLREMHLKIIEMDTRAQEFLEFLRLETGTIEFSPEETDITHLLRRVAAELMPLFRSRGCSIVVELPDSLPAVMADTAKTRQVTSIFLRSALHFLPPGGKAAFFASLNGGFVWIEVRLADVVIEAGDALFNPYASNKSETTTRWRVGMALAKRLVEISGGQVTVESKPGRGTRFGFSLPVA